MAERFTRLFLLSKNLYAVGSPVIILAGALLKDNANGQVLAQLKFKNIANKNIKALTVCVTAKDTVGRKLGDSITYHYLDLNIRRDLEFGSKTAILMSDENTRAFEVDIREVVFDDNSVWSVSNTLKWETLSKQEKLFTGEPELEKQYNLEINSQAQYKLLVEKDLWMCACGAVNRLDEAICHTCRTPFLTMRDVELERLKENCKERLEAEEAERLAAQEKAREEAEAKRIQLQERRKKVIKIAAITAVIVCVIVSGTALTTKIIIPSYKYNSAITMKDSGDFENAISAFEALNGYKDSVEQIEECEYGAAIALMESGDYEAAIKAFVGMDGYKDSADQITVCQTAMKEQQYEEAVASIDKEDYIAAYETLKDLNGYKDSSDLLESIKPNYEIASINTAEVGNTIIFGTYEQDNKDDNGEEDIEWTVLTKEDDRILVISKYALDCKRFNNSCTAVTWEDCSMRTWLNGQFLNAAFNDDEKIYIRPTDIQDQVFLLSETEAEQYFTSNNDRECDATAYSKAEGASVTSDNGKCCWWLRTSGTYPGNLTAMYVNDAGEIDTVGGDVSDGSNGRVRPAVWLKVES